MGVCYYSLMYMILDSVPEVAITVERKAVFYKQRDNKCAPESIMRVFRGALLDAFEHLLPCSSCSRV